MTKPSLRAELHIQEWTLGLANFSSEEFTQQNVERYIQGHAISVDSLKPYAYYSPKHYARNLIFKNDVFECVAMCWDIGQSSAVHDHNDRLGFVYLATGHLFVQNYRIEGRDTARHTCRVIPTDTAELVPGGLAEVDTERGVHKVCNLPRFHERALSVHVYQRPMDSCEIYSLAEGTYERVQLVYTSEYGRLNPNA